jgi:ATP-dependent RNA helicase SUPV3L1/SUV3
MAKKKKKQNIKINNKIRELMNGKPFDEGIRDIDDNILIELTMILDLKVPMLSRKEMIKALRRIWSEGNTNLRLSIIDYLEQLGVKSPKQNKKDKVGYILSILDNFEHTREEEDDILATFIDSSYPKITKDKIKNRLSYIRHRKKIEKWQQILKVEFNTLSQMEFYHSYNFDMYQESFSKSLLTITDVVDMKLLDSEDKEKIKSTLLKLKENAILKKEEEINTFLTMTLNKGHSYLKPNEIIELVKKMPPEDELYEIDIHLDILKRIIHQINQEYRVVVENQNIYIAQDKTYTLYDKELPYTIVATYKRSYFYNLIWKEEELPIVSDLTLIKKETRKQFENSINDLEKELNELSYDLDLNHKVIHKYILKFVEPQVTSSRSLKINEKLKRRVHYHFLEYIKPLKEKKKKEELLANTIRDFKSLYPIARLLKREIIFHVGPTNSGKTYEALNHLKKAETGYYLAPLRLLALEGYESLKEKGVNVSLITGEEEIIDEDSTHISSTIEMMNASVEVDVAIIDEIQMINDRDRGWAWANALIGVPAKKVILTGSIDALDAITKLCEYLEEPLEIIHFERKNELKLLPSPTPINAIKKGTAIVAFSRRDVLTLRQQLSNRYEISVVYGNLSPEVRREEARRFREGESDILIATDAISMGLNLPIKTLLFAKDNKFDGLRRRELMTTEIIQIAGRAGRYGLEEVGYIGALDKKTLETIQSKFYAPLPPIKLPFSVMASLEHVMLIGEILETENLSTILNFFADNMEFEGPFIAANIDSMLEIASIVSEYNLDLKTRYYLACSPASISSPYIESVFHRYIKQLEAKESVKYIPPRDLPKFARTNEMMLNAEDRVREISLYLWLSFKFPDYFPDTQKAIEARGRLNKFIESSLKEGNFVKYCNRCGKALDFSYKFSICDRCFAQKRRGNYNKNRKYKDK